MLRFLGAARTSVWLAGRQAGGTLEDRETRMRRDERVRHLRDLADRLALLPATEARDKVLRQVRARAVDVDTGSTTSPVPFGLVNTRDAADAAPVPPPARVVPAKDRPARRPRAPTPVLPSNDILIADGSLSLEDRTVPSPGSGAPGAWVRGLRG